MEGSLNNLCNVETGDCECKTAAITSKDCSVCADTYYGFPNCQGRYLCFVTIIATKISK